MIFMVDVFVEKSATRFSETYSEKVAIQLNNARTAPYDSNALIARNPRDRSTCSHPAFDAEGNSGTRREIVLASEVANHRTESTMVYSRPSQLSSQSSLRPDAHGDFAAWCGEGLSNFIYVGVEGSVLSMEFAPHANFRASRRSGCTVGEP